MTSAPHSTLAASESAAKQPWAPSRAAHPNSSTMGNVFQRQTEADDNRVQSADGDSISCKTLCPCLVWFRLTESQLTTPPLRQHRVRESQIWS
jgi:hypothetical protein